MSFGRKKFRAACLAVCFVMLFSCFMPLEAKADNEIGKVLATTSSAPVAIVQISAVSVSTSTEGCYVNSLSWYDTNGNLITGYFKAEDCRIELEIAAQDGYIFAQEPEVYLNNEKVEFQRGEDGKTIIIQKVMSPLLWQPTPIKHPGGETVTEGGWASFVATAMYANDFQWCFISPDGKNYDIDRTKEKFPGLTVDGNGSGKILVHNIPLEMNGWKAACKFVGPGGSILSNGALITVNPDPAKATPTPVPEETPQPEEKTDEEPEKKEDKKTEGKEDKKSEEHVHEFADEWFTDEKYHWHQCSCGEKSIIEAHSFSWDQTKKPTKRSPGSEHGTCTVCGYETDREVEYEPGYKDNSGFKGLKLVIISIIVIALLCLAAFIYQVVHSNRYSRRGKHMKK